MTITIAAVGNCQVGSLARCLRAYLPQARVEIISIEKVLRESSGDAMAEIAAKADIVLSQDLRREKLGDLRTARLAPHCRNLLIYPTVVFTGFHPDAASIAHEGRSVQSPTGAYHSEILLAAHLAGLPLERAIGLFSADAYERLGYFDEFAKSVAYLVSTAQGLGYHLGPEVDGWLAQGSFMFSFNHPKVRVMASIARQCVDRLGMLQGEIDPDVVEEMLGRASRWPVYPEIAERLGLDEPFVFRKSVPAGGAELSLQTFAEQSYQLYAGEQPDVLAKAVRTAALELAVAAA